MQHITLNNGQAMPQLGFGVWQVPEADTEAAVTAALQTGYRSIDTASAYANEAAVGRAVAASGTPREELFVTTKLRNSDHGRDAARRAFDASVQLLGVDYVDLYLIHWPVPEQDKYVETWKAVEEIYAEGRAKTIGVSNFTVECLERLISETEVVPAVNQIELHPYFSQRGMRAVNAGHGVVTEAWSPLGQGKGLLDDPVLARVGAAHAKTPAQVVLRWHVQLGHVVIPKSVTPTRIAENFDVFDFVLSEAEMDAVSTLDCDGRIGPDPAQMNWLG